MGNLSRLTNLNVDRNRLHELPIEIGLLGSLNVLSLRENKLTLLPQELGDCGELHVLDVSGNRYGLYFVSYGSLMFIDCSFFFRFQVAIFAPFTDKFELESYLVIGESGPAHVNLPN